MTHHEQSRRVSANLRALVEKHGITHQAIADKITNRKSGNPIKRASVTGLLIHRFSPTVQVLFQYLNAVNELAGTDYQLKDIQP